MTRSRLSETVRERLGWCPMNGPAPQEPAGGAAAIRREDDAAGAAPVARRQALFLHLTFAIVVLSWIVGITALPYLPEIIPVHWNMYGEPDGFASRLVGIFTLPAIMTLTAILLIFLPRFDRYREGFDESRDIYTIVTFAVVCLLFGVHVLAALSSAGVDLPMGVAFPVLMGFFFCVVGSLMPSIRRNTTVGIRLPWTVRDESVWRRTHERGGPVFVIAGILMVLGSAVAGTAAMPLVLGILLSAILYITAWSYRLSRTGVPAGEG